MEVTLNKQTSRRLVKVTGHLLVQLLMIAVARLRKVEMELGDLDLELEDEQEEIESYSDDIGDCHDHIEDIDEFVRELEAGNVSAVSDAVSAIAEMTEEREENQNLLRVLADARACHEEQLRQLQCRVEALQKERIVLHKARVGIFCLFSRNGMFMLELVRHKMSAGYPEVQ